jgi:hypothetical protein
MSVQVLRELHAQCAPSDDGADVDSSKGTTQLEVYALEIQMYGELKNNKKLRVRPPTPHRNDGGRLASSWFLGSNRKSTKNRCESGPRSRILGFKASFASVAARCTCPRVRARCPSNRFDEAILPTDP